MLGGVVISAALSATCASTGGVPQPAAFPNAPAPPAPSAPPAAGAPSGAASFAVRDLLDTALSYQGVPYVYGGEDPSTGFDCSGYVRYVFAQHRFELPRTAAEQFRIGRPVKLDQARAGDLLFFTTVAPGASHVALALGNGAFVHAPSQSGAVRIENVESSYWRSRFLGARRLL